MRVLKVAFVAVGTLVGLLSVLVVAFRRNPRMGSSFVNSVVNPQLLAHGLSGRGRAEIGTLEHFGRQTGRRYLTPVHPEPKTDGFQILVPLGEHSHWARNVIAAGHCRIQLHDLVYQLDEPALVRPTALTGAPALVRRLEEYLGFEYLALHEFGRQPGALDQLSSRSASPEEPADAEWEPVLTIS